ncbi:helix-turn-helix domain-containing protein [Gordonibacter pamelaeae]|uniref:helix-turn-helix domain-containing protein n=1 Tax=Gordonibacter pamelaeae TaxID=471189 RepID=UPI00210D28D8|nr:helix-turn-helix domain-containing protein [Gordonibacter pamelaeae]MCQ4848383.1 helix-turn-helix domain-containing protein [Gordonibacter pamelaeae]MCQ4850798.1 helix-turn-helix domain-containing protein [Gordonibacter pamelaeae]
MTETARFLGVDRKTVRRYVDAGYLQAWAPDVGWRRISRDSIGRLCGIAPPPDGTPDSGE